MSDQPAPFVYAINQCGAEEDDGRCSCELGEGHDGQHMDGFHRWPDTPPDGAHGFR